MRSTLCDSILQSFMRRVRAEKAYKNIIPGSRVKQILLELCAARVIYPFSITDCKILSQGGGAEMTGKALLVLSYALLTYI